MSQNTSQTTLTWINCIHWYQPPTTPLRLLKKITEESYIPLVHFLLEHKHIQITCNITSCLTYMLYEAGYTDLISDIETLIHRNQIELLDSAAFHPILPLIDEEEVVRQIKIHQDMNHGFFKITKQPKGFFLPECAYSESVGHIVKKMGYEWIVLDPIALDDTRVTDTSTRYIDEKTGLTIVFRDHELSKTFVPDTLRNQLPKYKIPTTRITATDAEIYGHRHQDIDASYYTLISNPSVSTLTVSDYLDTLDTTTSCAIRACNWDSEISELAEHIPYFQWNNPTNPIHTALWKMVDYTYHALNQYPDATTYYSARRHFERGVSSCTFWWASGKDFELFSGPAWKPDEVERGAHECMQAIRTLPLPAHEKIQQEKKYHDLLFLIWETHWRKMKN